MDFPRRPTRTNGMRRARRVMASARRRGDSRRIGQAAALPLAGCVAMICVQLAILSANGELTLEAAMPMVWLTIAFTGLLAVFMARYQR